MVDLEYANRGRGLQTITVYTACSLDVERERRLVYGKVVPQLMAHARRKGVDFDYVDFRQGLKPGHTLTKTDLKLILREITNCNCFLAIIGSEMGEAAELPDELLPDAEVVAAGAVITRPLSVLREPSRFLILSIVELVPLLLLPLFEAFVVTVPPLRFCHHGVS